MLRTMSSNVNSFARNAGQLCRFLLFIVGLCWMQLDPAVAAERPSLLGISPAFPLSAPDSTLASAYRDSRPDWQSRIFVEIDSLGEATAVTMDSTIDSTVAQTIRGRLLALRYAPGMIDSMPQRQTLVVSLTCFPRSRMVSLRFPLDTTGSLSDHELLVETAKANGVVPAGIKQFPSFHSTFKREDSLAMYPYVLLEVKLDTLGRPRGVTVVRSTHPAFTQQIASAAYWAKYTPARAGKKAVRSVNWLLVSFFPLARYPTSVLTSKSKSKLPLLDQLGLRLYPDTLGLLSAPIVHGRQELRVTAPGIHKIAYGNIGVMLRVDTSGVMTATRIGDTRAALVNDVNAGLRRFRFYPAMDFSGQPCGYNGFAILVFDGSTEIRITKSWLPDIPAKGKR